METKDLLEKIKTANTAYRQGNSIMTDTEYDNLVEELKERDLNNEWFSKGIQDSILTQDRKQKLPIPMFSLEKVKSYEDIIRWIESCELKPSDKLIITPKYDGISLCVDEWNNYAWTRGDGEYGQKSDNHLKAMSTVKTGRLSSVNYTYGEAIFKTIDFLKIKEIGKYKSARNTVAGLFNSPIPSDLLKEVRYIRYGTDVEDWNKRQQLDFLKVNCKSDVTIYNVIAVESLYDKNSATNLLDILFEKMVCQMGCKCDGLVIDIDDASLRKKLGRLPNNNPRYAIAYKNPDWAEREDTVVKNVEWQISKDNRLVPVVEIIPVDLCGATVSRCTAYNARYITNNNIKKDSKITICRSGDVIPKHLYTNSFPKGPVFPQVCPHCGGNIIYDGIDLYCQNSNCKGSQLAQCVYFFSTMNFDEFRENTIKKFFDMNYNTPYKIININEEGLKRIGIGLVAQRVLKKQFDQLKSKGTSFATLLVACNVFKGSIAEKTCQKILDGMKIFKESDIDYEQLYSLKDRLISIEGIGESTAVDFIKGLERWNLIKSNYNMIPIIKYGIEEKIIEGQMTVVFTGFRDKNLENRLIELGHKIGSSVSKKTTCLIVKQRGSNSTKETKAESLNIPIFTLEEFEKKFLS